MLTRIATDGAPVFLTSPILTRAGVRHCFSTRLGGVSPAPFDSLNLGNPSGDIQDDRNNIQANYLRLGSAIGCAGLSRCWVHQVHGDNIACAARNEAFENGVQADALVSDDPEKLLSVRVADCAPVLLATADGRAVAAVHAGWRGVVAGVVARAARHLRQLHDAPVLAAIGPAIGFEHFEVGPEVLAMFEREFAGNDGIARRSAAGKGFVNLSRAIREQLRKIEIPDACIDVTDLCSYRDRDLFYSHRRDNGVTGRMAALIAASR